MQAHTIHVYKNKQTKTPELLCKERSTKTQGQAIEKTSIMWSPYDLTDLVWLAKLFP